MVVGGCAEVGSELRESMSRIHTRCNAHREQLENAMSAGASRFEMSFTPAVKLGAVVASIDRRHHDVLQISTDTFIDLEHALTVGHTKPSDNHLLNNFGIGLYVFQARRAKPPNDCPFHAASMLLPRDALSLIWRFPCLFV